MNTRQGICQFVTFPFVALAVTVLLVLALSFAQAAPFVSADPPSEGEQPANATAVSTTRMVEAEVAATSEALDLFRTLGLNTKSSTTAGHVIIELDGEQERLLKEHAIDYTVLRPFIYASGSGEDVRRLDYAFATANNPNNIAIPDADGWVASDIIISGIPAGDHVAGVDVHLQVVHTWIGDLFIQMRDPNMTFYHILWDRQGGSTDNIDHWYTNLQSWNGQEGNGTWRLWAQDRAGWDTGYIDFWEIRVYYGSVNTPTPTPTCGISLPSPYDVRVNAGGGGYTDGAGKVWAADRLFQYCSTPYWGATGGEMYTNTVAIDGTTDDALYQNQRYFADTNGYTFIVPGPGTYEVTLRFAEIYQSVYAGRRVFDVYMEDQIVASAIDVFQRAGGLNKAYDLQITVPVTDTALNIMFSRQRDKDGPFVSAIRVRQASTNVPTPTATATSSALPPGSYTLDLPVTNDTYTSQGNPVANYRLATDLYAGYQKQLRSWFKFNVSVANIPSYAIVSQANLNMYYLGTPGGDVSLDVFSPSADWSDATLTWNNQPAYNSTASGEHWVATGSPSYIAWNITGLFQQWVNGSQPNFGVMVTDHNDGNSARLASKENTGNHPAYIHVTFTVPSPGATAALGLRPYNATYGVGEIFNVDVIVEAGSLQVDSAQVFLNFNPAYLAVVDEAGNPTASIVAGSAFDVHLINAVDNAAGRIAYADGSLTGTPPSGTFTLATIRFRAKAAVATTAVTFSVASPRQSKLSIGGENILGTITNGQYAISESSALSGSFRLQGRPNPPSNLLAVPIAVLFFTPGSPVPFITSGAVADANGTFTVSGVPLGTWDVAIKNPQTLSSKNLNVTFASGTVNVNFGVLKEGDANNDDIVDITDFSLLRTTFLKSCGGAGFDERADFNGDCIVDISDFSLLRTNFLVAGPVIVP